MCSPLEAAVGLERLEELPDPGQRGEPPVLLRGVRDREVVRIARGEAFRGGTGLVE
jgi:hypothetical protein